MKTARDHVISKKDFIKYLELQDNKCLICGDKFIDSKHIHVDHDHTTGKFRGILCNNCNTGIGNSMESIEILKNMINYIEKYGR